MFFRIGIFSSLVLCSLIRVAGQSVDFVKNQGITSAFHRQHVGKIVFTTTEIPASELKSDHVRTAYELTPRSNLFMTVFLGNSLTNYLHPLAPELSADSLTKVGNYQFSFFVDHRLIYQTNLHPGAPYARIKNQETVVSKPLIDNEREGRWWSQSAWNRFMYNGGDSALTEGPHQFTLEIRPYVQAGKLMVGDPIATGELSLQVKRKPLLQLDTITLNTPKPYPGLNLSKERFQSRLVKELKGNIDAGVFKHITSVVVIKQGKLLLEEYFNGANRTTLHDTRSVGKSFTSTLTGIAIKDGHLTSENQSLKEFYDLSTYTNFSTDKAQTTIRSLLTMSSAFDGNDDDMDSPGNEENMYPTENWVKFVLDLPVTPRKFSSQWHYFTAGVVVLGDILNKVVPENLDVFSRKKLFNPLGITDYNWLFTPQKVVNTAGGIRLRALDLAKYGQLYKNRGTWNGKQILLTSWVDKTLSKQKKIPGRTDEYYGYLFWNKRYTVHGKAYETYYCTGNGGNKVFIFKDQPLVIVVTATAYNAYYAHPQVDQMMEKYILPAVID